MASNEWYRSRAIERICLYTMQVIKNVQVENIKSFDPKQEVADLFNKQDRRSWYKNAETGKVFSIWPGCTLHYM
jgi:hypothetical protein